MAARSDQWHVSGWPAILLVPIVLPLAIVVNLVVRIFGLKNTRDRSPGEVVGYLHDFIEGCGGEWDWDDFTSVPITALELEAIRQEAEMIDLPVTDAGRAKLQDLLARARALI